MNDPAWSDAATAEPAAAPSSIVLFDFDGVLMHGDAFSLFMRDRFRHSLWRTLLALLCTPLLLLQLPFSRSQPVRTLVRVALLGLGEPAYGAAATAFAARLARRPGQFCRDGLHALRRHQAAGERVIVVTGCEQALVTGILRELGLDRIEVVASQLRFGRLGMRVFRHNVGSEKPRALLEHGISAWRLAYGDSRHDIPMLKGAAEAVLVNGAPKLCKQVERALGRSITRVDWF